MERCDNKGLCHYLVESVTVEIGGSYLEPPEPTCFVDLVLAPNARRAKVLALQGCGTWEENWSRWRREVAGCNPYSGLKASRYLCEHGTCMGCWPIPDETDPWGIGCEECRKNAEALDEALAAELNS